MGGATAGCLPKSYWRMLMAWARRRVRLFPNLNPYQIMQRSRKSAAMERREGGQCVRMAFDLRHAQGDVPLLALNACMKYDTDA